MAFAVCYLTIDNQTSLDATLINNISIIEISRYYQPVDEVPPTGISTDACTYNLLITEMSDRILLTIKGPKASTFADSRIKGLKGFQQAFFRAIIKDHPDKKSQICQRHPQIVAEDCGVRSATKPVSPAVTNFIITDNNTGLVWQKGEAGRMKWDAAINYCINLSLAGMNDWRLPNKTEIISSYQIQQQFPNLSSNYYWTSTINKDYNDYSWGYTPSDGSTFDDGYKTSNYSVRCVRGNSNLPMEPTIIAQRPDPVKQEPKQEDQLEEDNRFGWRFVVAPTYVSGLAKVLDIYTNNYEKAGYSVSDNEGSPIGISFNPYLQKENGLRIGMGFGPLMVVILSAPDDEMATFVALPMNINIGFTTYGGLFVRGGVSKLNASGDFVVSESLGLVGAVGVELNRKKRVSVGFELGIDTSTVELEKTECSSYSCTTTTEKINPVGLTASVLIVF